ncbi:WG repeat-containing protein, partial [Clostridium estertheticum]|uniref:WG repeat-containing protein n=2 Tax=Clostridium TaxID=1485 RepID=UPI001C0C03E9
IEIGGKWGFINKTGEIVIKPQFDFACNFSEGLAAIKVEGKSGFINKNGKIVIKPQFDNIYDDVSSFHEGLAMVNIGGKWGFIINPLTKHIKQ